MDTYMGCKIIQAEPMDECTFLREIKGIGTPGRETREGYVAIYPDGYTSWSPKGVFESAYRLVTSEEKQLI